MPGTTPDFRRDVAKIGAIFSEVQRDVVEMRQIMKSCEDGASQNRVVSGKTIFYHHRSNSDHRLDSKQVSWS
jgi:hypothetical protein